MSIEKYGQYVPYLRRFARALTGSQINGDLYVKTALQALMAVIENGEVTTPPKIQLYRALLKVWSNTGSELESDVDHEPSPANRVRRLAPEQRQAFVLNALEGMTEKEIAQVMDVSLTDAIDLLASAEVDIETELETNILIIEDEPIIASDIQGIVEELGHSVCGIAATHKSALELIKKTNPGIILSDVNLADGSSGIDAVTDILAGSSIPVIFVTAFPEQLLTGERPEPAYLISKPFEPENLKAAISQALFFHNE